MIKTISDLDSRGDRPRLERIVGILEDALGDPRALEDAASFIDELEFLADRMVAYRHEPAAVKLEVRGQESRCPERLTRLRARDVVERTIVTLARALQLIEETILHTEEGEHAGEVVHAQGDAAEDLRRFAIPELASYLNRTPGPVVRCGHIYRHDPRTGRDRSFDVDRERKQNRERLETWGLDPDAPEWADVVQGAES